MTIDASGATRKDIERAEPQLSHAGFMHGVSYFMHSAHAHATADGMREFKTLRREQFFTCELGLNPGQCTTALQGANTYLCWLLGQVCVYLGLSSIEADLDGWFKATTERLKQASSQPPT